MPVNHSEGVGHLIEDLVDFCDSQFSESRFINRGKSHFDFISFEVARNDSLEDSNGSLYCFFLIPLSIILLVLFL